MVLAGSSGATNTGLKDADNRTIYRGPGATRATASRIVEFVLVDGRRKAPRKGRAGPLATGEVNAIGREIFRTRGPKGTEYVIVNGKRRIPSRGVAFTTRRASSPRAPRAPAPGQHTGAVDGKGRAIMKGPQGGLYVIGPKGTKIPPATRTTRASERMRTYNSGLAVNWSGNGMPARRGLRM